MRLVNIVEADRIEDAPDHSRAWNEKACDIRFKHQGEGYDYI